MKRYSDLFKEAWNEFWADKAQRLAAGLSYYTLFSIAPLLLIVIAIAGLVFGRSEAETQIVGQLRTLMGESGAKSISELLESASKPKTGTFAIIIGAVTLLFVASGVFGELKDAMNTIWNVEEKKVGIKDMLRQRFLSFAMVLGVGFLLLVSLILDAAVASMGKFAGNLLPGGETLWHSLELIVSYAAVTVLFAMMFRFLPDVRVEWRDVWFGAGFTAVLFVLGKFALGLYLGKGAVGSSYGAAGSLVVLLVWVYWSANILFFGAEFTQVYARSRGSRALESGGKAAALKAVAPPPQSKNKPGSAAAKLAIGGVVGLVIGTLLGGLAAVLVFFKSVKKMFT